MEHIIIQKIESIKKNVERLEVMQANAVNYVQPYFYNEPGTITVSGTTVTGTNTNFTAADVGRDIFWSPSTGAFVWVGRILVFISATSVTLSTSYSGSAITDQSFHLSTAPGLGTTLYPSALTLSRQTLTFATNVFQIIPWQFLTRNTTDSTTQVPFSITLPTTQVPIPQTGYYVITMYLSFSVATTTAAYMGINGQFSMGRIDNPTILKQIHTYTFVQYFLQGDYFELGLQVAANCDLQTNLERTANQSPYLYVARIA